MSVAEEDQRSQCRDALHLSHRRNVPEELYYQQFNNGAFRTAEALREQVIDAAVDEVRQSH